MRHSFDREADALYIYLNKRKYAYSKALDDERNVDYADDGTPIGIELLFVSGGVLVSGLPEERKVVELLSNLGIESYTTIEMPQYDPIIGLSVNLLGHATRASWIGASDFPPVYVIFSSKNTAMPSTVCDCTQARRELADTVELCSMTKQIPESVSIPSDEEVTA